MANKPTAMKNDAIGNPTTWYDGTSFTWANGRRLASATNTDEGLSATYTYDADGLRLTKTINGVEHKYLWQGSKLVSEYYDGKELEFFYDESGNPYAFSYKASSTATPVMYYYLTNLQGDVTGILDSSGTTVAAYTYNAWGRLLSSSGTLADLNPLRYRGYYYDSETGLYYVSSRYYDPEICRFINADGFASNGQGFVGTNMFAYCLNNPVIYADSTGTISELVIYPLLAALTPIVYTAAVAITAVVVVVAVVCLVYTAADYVNEYSQHNTANIGTTAIPSANTTTDNSLEKSQDKTREKIKKSDPRIHYWVALYTDYGGNRGTYIPTQPLQYFQAVAYVKSGGSVFADSRHNAYKLAIAVGQGNPYVKKEIHGAEYDNIGYWDHYHAGGHKGGHIFYV